MEYYFRVPLIHKLLPLIPLSMARTSDSSSSISTVDLGASPISAVHADVLRQHILNRLDGVSLASLSCASTRLRSLAAADDLVWKQACLSTWPSTSHPRVQNAITSFPTCHRGFFSDTFPTLCGRRERSNPDRTSPAMTEELISAVDIYYRDEPVFSKVQETETLSGWFEHSPFRIDLLGPKESFQIRVGSGAGDGEFERELEENMKLSWIVIDPTRKKAANLSSVGCVSVERHWLTGEVAAKFSTVVGVGRGRAVEVEVKVVVTRRGKGVHVREVGMRVEDMEGKWVSGKESLGILREAMEFGERKTMERERRGKERYGEFLEMKKVWRKKEERRERMMEMGCVAVGAFMFMGFFLIFFLVLWRRRTSRLTVDFDI